MSGDGVSRREFVGRAGLVAAGLPLVGPALWHPGGSDVIGIGVVGTGARGRGAVHDCLSVNEDVRLVAMGDLETGICRGALKHLEGLGDKIAVEDDAIFGGLDAYRKVIEHPKVDVVILTTPPGFRPLHLAAVVEAGKHCFVEKPVCVDAAGYHSCLRSGAVAARKKLAVVTGTQYRRQPSYVKAIGHIHDGVIGQVTGGVSYYCSTGIWHRPRKPGMSEARYQLHNWYHYLWLCGDQIVEQAVHNIDAVNWVMGGPPVEAFGSGGQMTRPADSEIWDNMNIDYTYPNGAVVSFKCRQIPNSTPRVINTFFGTRGVAHVNPGSSTIKDHQGKRVFRHRGRGNNPYQEEHRALIASIREGRPIMEIEDVAKSSLTAVMGRHAAYGGKSITWDDILASTEDLMPEGLTLDGNLPGPRVPIPGQWSVD